MATIKPIPTNAKQGQLVEVKYNFWNNGLRMTFDVINKSDSIVTLDMAKSMYVVNGRSEMYFTGKVVAQSIGTSLNKSSQKWGLRPSISTSVTVTDTEMRYYYLAPHSKMTFTSPVIQQGPFVICRDQQKTGLSFTEQDSPYVIRNFLSYVVGADGGLRYHDDKFYLSGAYMVKTSDFYGYPPNTSCAESRPNLKLQIEKLADPLKLYFNAIP